MMNLGWVPNKYLIYFDRDLFIKFSTHSLILLQVSKSDSCASFKVFKVITCRHTGPKSFLCPESTFKPILAMINQTEEDKYLLLCMFDFTGSHTCYLNEFTIIYSA